MSDPAKRLGALIMSVVMVTSMFVGVISLGGGVGIVAAGNVGNVTTDDTPTVTVNPGSADVVVTDVKYNSSEGGKNVTNVTMNLRAGDDATANLTTGDIDNVTLYVNGTQMFERPYDEFNETFTLGGVNVSSLRLLADIDDNETADGGKVIDTAYDFNSSTVSSYNTKGNATFANESGFISGRVSDQNNNDVKNATLNFTQVGGGLTKNTTTNSAGEYTIELPVGDYNATVTKRGFSTAEAKDLRVKSNKTTTANFVIRREQVPTTLRVVDVDPTSATVPADGSSLIAITVNLTDQDGQPIGGAQINASNASSASVLFDSGPNNNPVAAPGGSGNGVGSWNDANTTLSDGTTTFYVKSSVVQTVPILFAADTNASARDTQVVQFGVLSGEGRIPGQVFDRSTTSGLEDADVYTAPSTRYRKNTIWAQINYSDYDNVSAGDTVFIRVYARNASPLNGSRTETLDNFEYEAEVGPVDENADDRYNMSNDSVATDVENVPLSIGGSGDLYTFLARYGQFIDEDAQVGWTRWEQKQAVGEVDELNTTNSSVGSGYFVKDRDGDGLVGFFVTPLEVDNYSVEFSVKQTNASRQNSSGTGPDDDFTTLPEYRTSSSGDLFVPGGYGINESENLTLAKAKSQSDLSDGPILFDQTDGDGDYLLRQLFTDFNDGRFYTIIAQKPGYDRDWGDVLVKEDGYTYEDEEDEVLELEPRAIDPDVNVTDIARLPNATATLAGPADEPASYAPYAYSNKTDPFSQTVPRDGDSVDVVLIETFGEDFGGAVNATVTLEVPDRVPNSTASNANNFNGDWIAVAGGTVISEDPVNNTITIATGSDGQAIAWLQADFSAISLAGVDTFDTKYPDICPARIEDEFSGIFAQVESNAGGTDATCKNFAGITQYASISGIVTDEENNPRTGAEVWVENFELRQNRAELTLTEINTTHLNISVYEDEDTGTRGVWNDTFPTGVPTDEFNRVASAEVRKTELDYTEQPGESTREGTGYFFRDFSNMVRQQYGLLPPNKSNGFTLYTLSSDDVTPPDANPGEYTLPRVPAKGTRLDTSSNNEYLVRGQAAGEVGTSNAFTRTNVTDDANIVIPGLEAPSFTVGALSAPSTATAGDTITVSADVTNTGGTAGAVTASFRLDLDGDGDLEFDEELASENLGFVRAGETRTVEFDIDTTGVAPGTYTHGVVAGDGIDTAEITIEGGEPVFDVSAVTAPDVTKPDPLEISATVENTGDSEGTQSISFNVSGEDTATGSGALDIAIVFDTTGSMGEEISGAKSAILDFTDEIDASGVDARYALVTFKDDVTVNQDFTSDASTMKSAVDPLSAAGGSRIPEDSYDALSTTVNDLERRSSARLVVIHVTDAPSHYRGDGSDVSDLTRSEAASQLNGANAKYILAGPTAEDYFSPPDDEGNVTALAREDVTDSEFVRLASGDFGDLLTDEIASAVTEAAGGTTVTLAPGESTTVEFSVSTSDLATGDYSVSVSSEDDSGSTTTTISEGSSCEFTGAVADADADDNCAISDSELQDAVVDWAGGAYTDAELQEIIITWSTGGS